jgi:adenylate cyclase
VANVLVGLLGDGASTQAAELAVLFQTGREFTRAAEMFLRAAGNAGRVYAHMDSLSLARRGLACLAGLPQTHALAKLELDLRMSLALQLQVTQSFAAAEAEQVYTRARALCELIGPEAPLFEVLWGLMLFYKVRSDLKTARQLAEQLFQLAEKGGDPGQRIQARQGLSVTALCCGEPATVREHMEQASVLYDPERHRAQTARYGQDPGVACSSFGALALWLLGYPDQAAKRSDETLEWSQRLSQPSTQSLALHFAAMLRQLRREAEETRELAEASFALAAEHGLAFWQAGAGDPPGDERVGGDR